MKRVRRPAVPIPLDAQREYMGDLRSAFAVSLQRVVGGEVVVLCHADRRLVRDRGYDDGARVAEHAFVVLDDGTCADVRGRRSMPDMLGVLGIPLGFRYELERGPRAALAAFPVRTASIEDAEALVRASQWQEGVPDADDAVLLPRARIPAANPKAADRSA